jgi:hypothetical protein
MVCFDEEISETKVKNPKSVLGSNLGEIGFRIIIVSMIFNDMYRMIRPNLNLVMHNTQSAISLEAVWVPLWST